MLALLVVLESLFLLMVALKLFPFPGENLSSVAFKQLWRNMLKPVQKKKKNVEQNYYKDNGYKTKSEKNNYDLVYKEN